jgi:hypothetical protein
MWSCIVTNFLVIKPTRCTNFSNLFWNETLHVSDSFSVHHQELFTVHSAILYVIQGCRQLSRRIRMEHTDPARKLSEWHIPLLSWRWITPDDGQRNCPKHVGFHFQNKIWEINASRWFYYKECCHSVRSHEYKLLLHRFSRSRGLCCSNDGRLLVYDTL